MALTRRIELIANESGFLAFVLSSDGKASRQACPPITTVAQNFNEIGRLAIELLLHKLGESGTDTMFPKDERILLNAEIMLRSSA